jgi:choice-of-anchor C domain-containing protein
MIFARIDFWRVRLIAPLIIAATVPWPHLAGQVVASSTFDVNLDGWTCRYDSSCTWDAAQGNPGGVLASNTPSLPAPNWTDAPAKFLGSWTTLNGVGTLKFDYRVATLGDGGLAAINYRVDISGPGGSAFWTASYTVTVTPWETFVIPIDPVSWTVSSGSWLALISNVTLLRINAEAVGNFGGGIGDINLIDNVVLSRPGPDLTVTALKTGGIVTDTQSLAISGVLVASIRNVGTLSVASPFRIIAWEDRDGNGQFNPGTDVTLGSVLYSSGLAGGSSADVSIPLSGAMLFRGNRIYTKVDDLNAIAETDETNNVFNTGLNSQVNNSSVPCPSSAPGGLTLTPAAINQGFCLSVFADGFSIANSAGPLGIAFPNGGGVLVTDDPGNVRLFPSDLDGQHAGNVPPAQSYGVAGAVGLARSANAIYVSDQINQRLSRLNNDGTFNSVVVNGLHAPLGVAANPLDGHLFVATANGIINVDPNTNTSTAFSGALADGISISPDGAALYAASNNHILGFSIPNASQVFDSGVIATVDGTAAGAGSLAGAVFANTNDGRVVETILATGVQIPIATGGSRGDFVAVDPNGTLLLTQTDSIYRLIPPAGGAFASSPAPDLTASYIRKPDSAFPASVQLTARIGNGGGAVTSGMLGPDIIQNGSFELASSACSATTNSQVVEPGFQILSNWRALSQPVHLVGSSIWQASDGICSLDFTGIAAGAAVEQLIPTIPGHSYEVTLFMSRNPAYNIQSYISVQAAGQSQIFGFADFQSSAAEMKYVKKPWHFTATASQTTLHIESLTYNTLSGAVIDKVTAREILNPQSPLLYGLFDTGVDDTGRALPTNGQDSHYITVSSPIPAGPTPIVFCSGFWIPCDATSNWITASAATQGILGEYTYQLRFNLAGIDPSTVRVYGRLSSDNEITSVKLNGQAVPIVNEPQVPSYTSYEAWTTFFLDKGFVGGLNTIQFNYIESGLVNGFRIEFIDIVASSIQKEGTISVAFYRGDPATGGALIGTTQTTKPLNPGEYEDVSVIWSNPPAGLHPIVVVADDDGTSHGSIAEGDETNNKAGANILLGVGPFATVDDLTARFKSNSVDLRWSAISGASGYNVYRRTGSASPVLARSGGTGTTFSDANLTNATIYYYSVRWLNAQGKESGDGTEASATPTVTPTTATPPTILSSPVVRSTALTAYSYQVRASDPDAGDVLTYSLLAPPAGMTISLTGLISWAPTTPKADTPAFRSECKIKPDISQPSRIPSSLMCSW